MRRISFDVVGTPAPKGSSRAIMRGGRPIVVQGSSNVTLKKQQTWASCVSAAAAFEMQREQPIAKAPLQVDVTFILVRPAAHYGRKGLLPSAPAFPAVKPDIDKLARQTLDAMTGIVFDDDSRIVSLTAHKVYAAPGQAPGARIIVEEIAQPLPPGQRRLQVGRRRQATRRFNPENDIPWPEDP